MRSAAVGWGVAALLLMFGPRLPNPSAGGPAGGKSSSTILARCATTSARHHSMNRSRPVLGGASPRSTMKVAVAMQLGGTRRRLSDSVIAPACARRPPRQVAPRKH